MEDNDSACLAGRPDEDLVERDPVRLANSKGDRCCDVLCLQRTDGIVETLCILANVIVTDVVGQLGGDGARFNDDHTYAGLNEFLAQSVRPGSEAPLGGVVNRVVGAGRAPCDRADVDDVALSGDKLRQKDVADEQHAGEVGVDHAPPLVDLAGGERREQHDAGVVDEYVHRAERGADNVRRVQDGVAVLHVGDAGDRFTAGSCDLGRQTLDAPGAARQQRHRRALGCECPRRCLADATGGAGDDRRTSYKVLAHVVLHVWFRGCLEPARSRAPTKRGGCEWAPAPCCWNRTRSGWSAAATAPTIRIYTTSGDLTSLAVRCMELRHSTRS